MSITGRRINLSFSLLQSVPHPSCHAQMSCCVQKTNCLGQQRTVVQNEGFLGLSEVLTLGIDSRQTLSSDPDWVICCFFFLAVVVVYGQARNIRNHALLESKHKTRHVVATRSDSSLVWKLLLWKESRLAISSIGDS